MDETTRLQQIADRHIEYLVATIATQQKRIDQLEEALATLREVFGNELLVSADKPDKS